MEMQNTFFFQKKKIIMGGPVGTVLSSKKKLNRAISLNNKKSYIIFTLCVRARVCVSAMCVCVRVRACMRDCVRA